MNCNQKLANTTDDQDYMKEMLGMNPGVVDEYRYFGVTLEPIGFNRESDLGWGEVWSAMHFGYNGLDPLTKKNIGGRQFTISKYRGKSASFKRLLTEWKHAQGQEYVPGCTSLAEA